MGAQGRGAGGETGRVAKRERDLRRRPAPPVRAYEPGVAARPEEELDGAWRWPRVVRVEGADARGPLRPEQRVEVVTLEVRGRPRRHLSVARIQDESTSVDGKWHEVFPCLEFDFVGVEAARDLPLVRGGLFSTVLRSPKSRYRGLPRNGLWAYLVPAAYNLVRIVKLMPAPA